MKTPPPRHSTTQARGTIAVACIAVVIACIVTPCWLHGYLLPSWSTWHSFQLTEDLDGDGARETVALLGRQIIVSEDGEERDRTPADWFVSDAHIGDITHDGTPEILALLWKRGSFGSSRPFWVERDEPGFSQHVAIYDYDGGSLQQVWMSSRIGVEASDSWIDGAGRLHLLGADGDESVWNWESWGLVLEGGDAQASREDPDAQTVTLLAAGDVIAHSPILEQAREASADGDNFDFSFLFEHVEDLVKGADVAVVNQETPLVNNPERYADYPRFGTPQELGDALAQAGFDVVLGATNHAYDQGEDGVADTLAYWRAEHPEVLVAGLHDPSADAIPPNVSPADSPSDSNTSTPSGESGTSPSNVSDEPTPPVSINANGIRLALFDYTFGLNGFGDADTPPSCIDVLDEAGRTRLVDSVRNAEDAYDLTICFLHIGDEYSDEPNRTQRDLCAQLAEAGADAIICSHPHVLQPAETIRAGNGKEAVVFWSLGNLASSQMDPRTALGGTASLTLRKDAEGACVADFQLIPTVCHIESSTTQVYPLADYTDRLAARHIVNKRELNQPISISTLQDSLNHIG